MSKTKEFVFMCEHMGGATWTVEHQWAIEGEAEEVVRCRDCRHFAEGHQSGVVWGGRTPDWCVLRDYPTKGDGFCHKGMRRDER